MARGIRTILVLGEIRGELEPLKQLIGTVVDLRELTVEPGNLSERATA